jgi:CrcB protein
MQLFIVMAGGAIGAGARFLVGRALASAAFPYATLAVNVAGGLLMGLLAGAVARGTAGEGLRLFLGVGVLGGFTTFSAFSLDAVALFQRGAMTAALLYVLLSVAGSIAASAAGLQLARAAS